MRYFPFIVALLLIVPACGRTQNGNSSTDKTLPSDPNSTATDLAPVEHLGQGYFPLVDGVNYEFAGSFDGKTDRKLLRLRTHQTHGKTFYYFIEDEDNEVLIGAMCGLGAYDLVDDGIRTAEVSWHNELDDVEMEGAQLMLTLPPSAGDTRVIKTGDNTRRFVVEEFEDVRVPAGLFKHCAKIRIEDKWPDEEYTGHVWLAEGIGMIRWQRGTGRIDELVSVAKAPAK